MTRYYKVYIDCGFVGAEHEEIIEVPENESMPTADELEDIARDYMMSTIEYGAYECDSKGNRIE
jgi:hypothetical protein